MMNKDADTIEYSFPFISIGVIGKKIGHYINNFTSIIAGDISPALYPCEINYLKIYIFTVNDDYVVLMSFLVG